MNQDATNGKKQSKTAHPYHGILCPLTNRLHCRAPGDICPHSTTKAGQQQHLCSFHKNMTQLRTNHATILALLQEVLAESNLNPDLDSRIRQTLTHSPDILPIDPNRLLPNGIALIDVYGNGDIILAAHNSWKLEHLLDEWQEIDHRYSETGQNNDWQPIEEWLQMHNVRLLKVYRKTL